MLGTVTATTTAPLGELVRIVGAMIPHVSKDRTRLALCSIAFDGATVTATNSYTAARYTAPGIVTAGNTMLIDGKELFTALTTLNKLNKAISGMTATITADGHEYLVQVDGVKNVHGGYVNNVEMPNVNHVIKGAGAKNTEIYSATGIDSDLLAAIATSHNRFVGKDGGLLVLSNWASPSKPMLFTTASDIGQLDQIVMPKRLK